MTEVLHLILVILLMLYILTSLKLLIKFYTKALHKLQSYGIDGLVLKWIKQFLIDQHQCVRANGYKSNFIVIVSEVPQGSVLSPILFLIVY